jgi:hypothetical protein
MCAAPSRSDQRNSTRLCRPGDSKKQPRISKRFMRRVQGSKGLFRRGFAQWDYAARATLGKSARICNMWRRPRPSMSFASSVGWVASLMPRPGNPPLPNFIVLLSNRGHKGSPTVIHALARTRVHEKGLYLSEGRPNAEGRFDTSAMSLTNSMTWIPPSTSACRSLASAKHVWENLTHARDPVACLS